MATEKSFFVTAAQLSQALGFSKTTIHRWQRTYPDFPVYRIAGNHFRYNLPEVIDWIRKTFGPKPAKHQAPVAEPPAANDRL